MFQTGQHLPVYVILGWKTEHIDLFIGVYVWRHLRQNPTKHSNLTQRHFKLRTNSVEIINAHPVVFSFLRYVQYQATLGEMHPLL